MSEPEFAPPPTVGAAREWPRPDPGAATSAPRRGRGPSGRPAARSRRARNRTIAWFVGGAALLAILGGVIADVLLERGSRALDPVSRGATGSIPAARAVAGLCLADAVDAGATVGRVAAVPCSEPHHAETVAQTTLRHEDWPGADQVARDGLDFCAGPVARIVPPDGASGLEWRVWAPSRESWEAGDRTVVCVVSSPAALIGSLEAGTAAVA